MIEELSNILEEFPGEANRSRCFTHVLNLSAKSVLRQFDLPKAKANVALSEAAAELAKLSVDLEVEERLTREAKATDDDKDDEERGDDNVDGWIDELEELDEEERTRLEEEAVPVRLMLVKVSQSIM